ncbi:zinc ion transmembrane transporter [Aureococcus anophagefferens]|nr:zinc ion transmembrane transporter [Aureococcus anophagefferens]
MDELEDVIKDICQGCAGRGQRVPAVLAAFIARTILESDPLLFSPEKELTSEGVDTLIRMSIARLCEKDAEPRDDQDAGRVRLDDVRFEEELDKSRKAREEKKRELVRAILAVKPRGPRTSRR